MQFLPCRLSIHIKKYLTNKVLRIIQLLGKITNFILPMKSDAVVYNCGGDLMIPRPEGHSPHQEP